MAKIVCNLRRGEGYIQHFRAKNCFSFQIDVCIIVKNKILKGVLNIIEITAKSKLNKSVGSTVASTVFLNF